MRMDFGGFKIPMPKHAGDAQDVRPIFPEMGGEAVARGMWRDWRRETGLLGIPLELLPTPLWSPSMCYGASGHWWHVGHWQERHCRLLGPFSTAVIQSGGLDVDVPGQPSIERLSRGGVGIHQTFLAPFTVPRPHLISLPGAGESSQFSQTARSIGHVEV